MPPVHDPRHDDRVELGEDRRSIGVAVLGRVGGKRAAISPGARRARSPLLDRRAIVGDPVGHAMQLRAQLLGASRRARRSRTSDSSAARLLPIDRMSDAARRVSYILPIQSAAPTPTASCAPISRWLAARAEVDRRRRLGRRRSSRRTSAWLRSRAACGTFRPAPIS